MAALQGIGTLVAIICGIAGLAISIISLRRSAAIDKREQEAIVVIRKVWERQYEDRFPLAEDTEDPDPLPAPPSQTLVISGDPTIDKGLALRPEDEADRGDGDRPGYQSHRILFELSNVGRAAATDVVLWFRVTGTFLRRFGEGTEARAFDQSIFIESLGAGASPYYLLIRNLIAIPVTLELSAVTSSDDRQPIRRAGTQRIRFHQRS